MGLDHRIFQKVTVRGGCSDEDLLTVVLNPSKRRDTFQTYQAGRIQFPLADSHEQIRSSGEHHRVRFLFQNLPEIFKREWDKNVSHGTYSLRAATAVSTASTII